MTFNIQEAISLLEKTPVTLQSMLDGLSTQWTNANEGEDSWSAYDVVGHLVHGEQTDWMPRLEKVLAEGPIKTFDPYDRFAQLKASKGKSIEQLLATFALLRKENLKNLRAKNLTEDHLTKPAIHPSLGKIELKQMLSAWVVHDLGHIVQIARVLAKQYKDEIGPWTQYLTVVNHTPKE